MDLWGDVRVVRHHLRRLQNGPVSLAFIKVFSSVKKSTPKNGS